MASEQKKNIMILLSLLRETYPDASCQLFFHNPFELLIATILSAQCTDARVNQVTPSLFQSFPTPEAFCHAPISDIEEKIKSINYFRTKARAIVGCAHKIISEYQGQVPANLNALLTFPGVGRKTAHVVLGVAYHIPSIVVDTHVGRLTRRMGLTTEIKPEKIEKDIAQVVPQEKWIQYNHLLIEHGRRVCTSRKAFCEKCVLDSWCAKKIDSHSSLKSKKKSPHQQTPS